MLHAPNSPDLNAEDHSICLEMWQRVYRTKFHNAKQLSQRMLDMRHVLKQSVINDAFGHQSRVIGDVLCMYSCNSTTLLAFSLSHSIHMQCLCLFVKIRSKPALLC